jgi:amino acid adenylation domain-containing protein/FkbH-like protein
MNLLGLEASITFAGYNQVLQEALDPSSASSSNAPGGFNLFLVRPGDLDGKADKTTVVTEITDALASLAARSAATQILIFCPGSESYTEIEEKAVASLGGTSNLEVIRSETLTELYPVSDIFDPEAERSGKIPFTEAMFAALATMLARRISLHTRPPAKVLVLDADNTLWGGIAGEDGPADLRMDGPWQALREFALAKRESGVLLCLCSKNQESDVARVFADRADDLLLKREDFAGWKVNWNAKSQNIRELANELNLGLDSFVFLDDNPAEIGEVAARCPGVLSLTLPESPEAIPVFLQHLWALDTANTTAADAARTEFYHQESARRDLRKTAPCFADFLRGLELHVEINEATADDLPRVAQLSKRTNQFNANPLRLDESDLVQRLESGAICLTVHVADRFGDYGLVGSMLYRFDEKSNLLAVGLFMLSCRAMGKGVERAMLISLGERAREIGAESVEVTYLETDRNEPCRRFFESVGGFTLPAYEAAELSPLPPEPGEKASDSTTDIDGVPRLPLFDAVLALRIATELRDPQVVYSLATAVKRPRPELSQALVRPGTATQKRLAAIWQDILGVGEIGLEDPFSALGGSSIQLVRLHVALKREFGSTLELVELFELPTIAVQAARLDAGRATATAAEEEKTFGKRDDDDAVAIIGMALRVPGANDPIRFWENLIGGVESITRFTQDEVEYPEEFDKPGYVPVKGLIDDIDKFDASFFGFLPKDAKIMDPQQRIFLELAWEAMERSGYTPETHTRRIGVYGGAYFDTYLLANLCTDREFLANLIPQIQVGSLQTELGNDKDYLATRVAFKLNLRGPAMTLQTACSTSMVAIIEACRAIRSGLCDMALAGGVTVTLPLKRGYFYTEQGMLSGDGHCRAYDEKATGTVFGNGAGVVMLKRLSDAIRDRDHIHAVIRGTGMNNDGGVKHSYTAPSVEGQVDVIRMAHRDAGVEASSIGYIEGHGTGTPLGDPIEVTALTKAFRAAGVEENQFCALGSLKTNIGHLDVASGVCGLIKTALSLENELLPPILHYQKPNPKIDFGNSPFYVNAKLTPWTTGRAGQPRRAGISAFGVGGTNAHVVLEEAPVVTSSASPRPHQLFLLSARTEEALAKASENLASFATKPGAVSTADAAWTLAIGRKPFRCRRAVAAENFEALAAALATSNGATGIAERSNPPVHFLFPGQGAQHVNMGRVFYESEPRFRETVDHCSEILRPLLGLNLTDILYPGEGADLEAASEQLKHTVLAQPAIFVIEYALADLWRHWGVAPTAMIGHSVGEFVAACHAGVFDLESGLKLLAARGRLMGDLPGGGMLSVRLSETDLLARLPDTLDLAAVNGPSLCVVAGPREELAAFSKALEADGIIAQILHTSHAFHSRMMDPVIDRFAAAFEGITLSAPAIPILSTVTGEWLAEKETTDPLYWAKHLREPVRFHRSVVTLGAEKPEQLFVEVGPGQTLTGLARQSLDRKAGHITVSTCRHVKETGCDHANLLESLGKLWTAGVEVDWAAYYAGETRKRVILPTYPFERKRHWVEATPMTDVTPTLAPPVSSPAPLSFPEPIPTPIVMSTPQSVCRRGTIATAIRAVLTDLSGIPEEELAGDASFLEQGFDSLLLTQVSKALQGEFKMEINLRNLMGELSSIDAMVSHLDAGLPADQYRPAAVEAPVPVAVPAQAPMPAVSYAAPVPAAMPVFNVPALGSGSVVEGVIAQQLELMRQQIALLQGGSFVASAPAPAILPAQSATAPIQVKPAPAAADTSSSANVSAPTTAINRNLDDSLNEQQRRHLDELIGKYIAKTRTSKELTAKYRQWHADPRTVSGFNRRWKEMIYQISVKKSKGSRLLDVDGNEYIDLLNGFGPNFLGHSPDFVTEALKAQLDRGVEVGPQCVTAMEAAQLFCEITGNERASFVNTGSEAVQAAMRLARTVTGRDKIVIFTKDYHGNFDEVLVKGVGSGDAIRSLPIAPGIPRRAVDDMIVLPYGTDEALEIIRARAHEVAAVIIEPVQSRRPEFQPVEFVRAVREITRDSGTVFVFDEVITGFRTGPRGAQEFYGVEADIATYGKVVGGGMPLGVIAGKAEYMDTFDGGMWQYGDDSFPEKGVTFFAGTFVRHPLAMAAVKEVLLHLKAKGPEFWQGVKDRATRLATTVDQMFVEAGAPIRMPNFGSQMFIRVDENHKYANLFFFHLRNKGVFLLEGFPTYMTAAHTDEDIDYVIAAFRESIAEMQAGGFFDVPAGYEIPHLNGSRLTGPRRLLSLPENAPVEAAVELLPVDTAKKSSAPTTPTVFPMTEPLAEVWLASQIGRNASLSFNEINIVTLRGALDPIALKASLQEVTDRHDSLRAIFPASGEGFTVRPEMTIELPLNDLSSLSDAEKACAVEEALDEERQTPFDLENGPLFRGSLLRLAPGEHLLILNANHLACDGWSYLIVLRELGEIYNARVGGMSAALCSAPAFGNYCAGAVGKETSEEGGKDESYWMQEFSEPVHPLNLPTDFESSREPDYRCDTIAELFTPAAMRDLRKAAGKSGSTLFGVLMSAYQILLHRISRQQRFVVGFPTAGQSGTGNEGLVGHCVNFLPFVADVEEEVPFSDFLKRTQGRLLDAMDHQDFTYGRLIKKFGSEQRPRVEAVFNLERVDDSLSLTGLTTEVREIERGYTTNALFLKAREYEAGLELRFDFQTALFSKETVSQWLTTYRAILESIIADPSAPVSSIAAAMSDSQIALLKKWNETAAAYPREKTIPQLFDEVALQRGDAIALRHEDGGMSYRELSALTDRITASLLEAGARPGSHIAVFVERSPLLIASLLAVMKTGATYLPLDCEYPEDRIRFMLEDSGAILAITQDDWRSRLPREFPMLDVKAAAAHSGTHPNGPLHGDATAVACVLYTSGSTGTPKGTLTTHRSIVRLVKNSNFCNLNEDETLVQASSLCFDASLFEIYGALLNGGVLALPDAGRLTIAAITESLTKHQVTTLWLTAGLFQIIVDEMPESFAGLRQLLSGGDVMTPDHAARLLSIHPGIRLINGYGPTENTTFTTCHTVTRENFASGSIPIGIPVANTTVWILDAHRQPVQPGIAGELWTGGDGLAAGYLGNPALTAEKFIPDPFSEVSGAKLYSTGDLCRFRHDGKIEFLGRIDHQVKIRGFRVEPGEIEANLGRHPHVGQCKVVVRGGTASEKSLAAYVAPQNGVKPTPAELVGYLRARLPEYLIPSAIVVMDELPLNANGKIDTRSLPDPGATIANELYNPDRPLTDTEVTLMAMWTELLRTGEVALDDDFFTLGGHSLLGMKLFVRIQKTFDVVLPLAALFRAPNVRQLAALIDEKHAEALPPVTPVQTANPAAPTAVTTSGTVADTTVAIQPLGDLPPLFAVHGGDGGILFYGNLAERLGNDRPFYAFEAPALTAGGPLPDESVVETAAKYLSEMRKVKPHGPYLLCGYSFGGVVAYEMACQIIADGEEVEFLGLVDTDNPAYVARKLSLSERVAVNWTQRNEGSAGAFEKFGNLSKRISSGLAYRLYFEAEDAVARHLPEAKSPGWLRQVQLRKAHERAMESYTPGAFAGKLTLFRAMVGNDKFEIGDDYGWSGLVDELEVIGVPGNHVSIFHKDNIDGVSGAFRQCLAKAGSGVII